MTYRYIYKITCTTGDFEGKFYFGQHTTTDLEDGYKGSGLIIQRYYKKHPNDYVKEIISFHNSQEELNQAEYDIVHPWLNHPYCLNLIEGGNCGKLSDISLIKMSKTKKGKHHSEEHRKHLSESQKGKKRKPHTEETRRKIGEALKEKKCKPFSEEHRKHLSESRKNKHRVYNDPNDKSKGFHYEK